MATWLLDANIIIYCLARDQILSNPRVAHLRERLDALDRALEEAIAWSRPVTSDGRQALAGRNPYSGSSLQLLS